MQKVASPYSLNAYSKPGSVIIMMPAALATGWFLPRLQDLRTSHPWVDPWLHTSDEEQVPEEAEIDIVLGPRPWAEAGAQSVVLAEDRLIPLCAPGLAAGLAALPEQSRLDAAALLHDETPNDWQLWFAQVGSLRSEFAAGFNFSDTGQMLQAAMLGHGVCLATARQAEHALHEGRLAQVAGALLDRTTPLHMSCWMRNFSRPPVRALWDWIEAQVKHASAVS